MYAAARPISCNSNVVGCLWSRSTAMKQECWIWHEWVVTSCRVKISYQFCDLKEVCSPQRSNEDCCFSTITQDSLLSFYSLSSVGSSGRWNFGVSIGGWFLASFLALSSQLEQLHYIFLQFTSPVEGYFVSAHPSHWLRHNWSRWKFGQRYWSWTYFFTINTVGKSCVRWICCRWRPVCIFRAFGLKMKSSVTYGHLAQRPQN